MAAEGELLESRSDTVEAEACYHRAINIARKQAARSLELRACTSLARLWQKLGARDAALELLASSYGAFTEGFATHDVSEARSVLAELR